MSNSAENSSECFSSKMYMFTKKEGTKHKIFHAVATSVLFCDEFRIMMRCCVETMKRVCSISCVYRTRRKITSCPFSNFLRLFQKL